MKLPVSDVILIGIVTLFAIVAGLAIFDWFGFNAKERCAEIGLDEDLEIRTKWVAGECWVHNKNFFGWTRLSDY